MLKQRIVCVKGAYLQLLCFAELQVRKVHRGAILGDGDREALHPAGRPILPCTATTCATPACVGTACGFHGRDTWQVRWCQRTHTILTHMWSTPCYTDGVRCKTRCILHAGHSARTTTKGTDSCLPTHGLTQGYGLQHEGEAATRVGIFVHAKGPYRVEVRCVAPAGCVVIGHQYRGHLWAQATGTQLHLILIHI